MNLSPKGQLYVTLVSAAGLVVIGHSIAELRATPIGWEWVVLAGLTLLSGSFTIRVPTLQARISVSETFVFTSVLLFGTASGTIIVAIDTLIAALSTRKKKPQPIRILFNLTSAALSLWGAGNVFFYTAGIQPLSIAPTALPYLLGPLVAMTTVYFLLNSGLVAFALAIERNESAFRIWRTNFLWLSVNYFGGASVAVLLVSYTRTIDFFSLSIIVPLIVISYLTFKTSLGRVEDAVAHVAEVNRLFLSTIETLATAIDAKDQVTHGHIRRVQSIAVGLAERIGVTDTQQIKAIETAALLHDMGKLAVPEHILNKPGRLTPGEFEKMKLHASVGAAILSSIRFPYPVVPIVRHHHENWDGTGYPDGIKGTQIPLGARILSVVDCFDALTSDRPYRPKLTDDEAVAILMQRRGLMYDPLVVDAFVLARPALVAAVASSPVLANEVEDSVKSAMLANRGESVEGAATRPPALQAAPHTAGVAVRTVLATIAAKTESTFSALYVKSSTRDELLCADSIGGNPELITGTVVPLGARVSGWVAANRVAVVDSDAALEWPFLKTPTERWTCAAIPVVHMSEVNAVIVIARRAEQPFGPHDVVYLQSVCATFSDPPLSEALRVFADTGSSDRVPTRSIVH